MAKRCPACKKGNLVVFDESPTYAMFTCTSCDKIITAKSKLGKIVELTVPGVTVITGSIAVLHFLGVNDISDLIDRISDSDLIDKITDSV